MQVREEAQCTCAVPEGAAVSECADFADWSTYTSESCYYSFVDSQYYVVSPKEKSQLHTDIVCEEGFKVVTENVPKNYTAALSDNKWGDPARAEWSTLLDSKAMIEVDRSIALAEIRKGADVVVLFPIYEEKMKEGQLVRKVRLVGNGKTQFNAGPTYSPTPSKEELLILLHICALYGWDYCHIDEIRAFLNAPYLGSNKVYAKLSGDNRYFDVLGALYGLKTSPRHYNSNSADRLISMGFNRLHMCSCIFFKRYENGHVVLVYAFVDDYIPCGSDRATTESFIVEFQKLVKTTPPVWNATNILGMVITRDWDKHNIQISVAPKIMELGEEGYSDS
jgi:hypothetical protein